MGDEAYDILRSLLVSIAWEMNYATLKKFNKCSIWNETQWNRKILPGKAYQACFYHNIVCFSKAEQIDSFLLDWVISEWSEKTGLFGLDAEESSQEVTETFTM